MRGVAFVFPGQGSQHPGMGRSLAEAFPVSRDVFLRADEALGFPLSETCFRGDETQLALTENTQPGILTVSVAALEALRSCGVRQADAAAGHSLGEYSAHVAAGTLSFPDAVRVVRLRGRFMQEAVPVGEGAMAAVLGLDPEAVETLCREVARDEVVSPANLNGPGQVVVAGHRGAVERASALARDRGARRTVPLPVSAPFHCPLMEPAGRRLAEVLRETPFADPEFPVFANADAAPVTDAARARRMLVDQVVAPVRWQSVIEAMLAADVDTFVEIGPGRVLSGLIRRIRRDATVLGVSEPGDVETAARLLEEAA